MMKKSLLTISLIFLCGTTSAESLFWDPWHGFRRGSLDDAFFQEIEKFREDRGSLASIDKDKIVLSYDVPGLSREDVQVTVESNRLLVIKGEKKKKIEEKKNEGEYSYKESRSFYRTMTLPNDAEIKKISAEVKDGILTVVIPRKVLAPESVHKVSIK